MILRVANTSRDYVIVGSWWLNMNERTAEIRKVKRQVLQNSREDRKAALSLFSLNSMI